MVLYWTFTWFSYLVGPPGPGESVTDREPVKTLSADAPAQHTYYIKKYESVIWKAGWCIIGRKKSDNFFLYLGIGGAMRVILCVQYYKCDSLVT